MKKMVLLFASLMLVFAGCASNKSATLSKDSETMHGRLMKMKNDLAAKGVIAEVAIAKSKDLQMGINKVELEARGALTRSLESKNSSLQKAFKEEVGDEFLDHFTQTTKNIASRVISGSTLIETPYEEKDGEYTVYGLMVLDPKLVKEALSAELASEQVLKTKWEASKAYKELEAETKAYEEFKKNH